MIADDNWQKQNKLIKLKERKKKIERVTVLTEKYLKDLIKDLNNFLWTRRENETLLECILSHALMLILSLDKVIGLYYMKFRILMNLKKNKKEINRLNKEIQKYESN